jgi:hypothetical protein
MFGRKKASPAQSSGAAEDRTGALLAAAQYVAMVSPPGAFVQELGASEPCFRATSPAGRRFEAVTDSGQGSMFFFPDHAAMWMSGEPQPRPGIPTDMINIRVPGYAEALADALKDLPAA